MKESTQYIDFFIRKYPFFSMILSVLLGYLVMPVVLQIAKKYDLVVRPNKRTSHEGKIPFVGGLNIFTSFFVVILLTTNHFFTEVQYAILGLTIILFVGFIDDLINIKVSWKLIGEIIAGFCLIVLSGVRIQSLHGFLGIYEIDILTSYIFSFFVFIGLLNAINLIDGIDGLASGLGIIYSLFFAIYFQLIGSLNLSIAGYTLAGSLFLFFVYNVFSKKRKLFMGDSGSLLLGYVVVFFIFRFSEKNALDLVQQEYQIANVPSILISLLIVPIYDTIRVMVTRIKKGVSPFKADKNHIHHLLLKLNFNHLQASLTLIGITLLFTFLGIVLIKLPILLVVLIEFSLATILTFYLWSLINKKNFLQK